MINRTQQMVILTTCTFALGCGQLNSTQPKSSQVVQASSDAVDKTAPVGDSSRSSALVTPSTDTIKKSIDKPDTEPHSLDELHAMRDAPAGFTSAEWTTLKEMLYHDGCLGHIEENGIFRYRNDPLQYTGVLRAMRDVFDEHGFNRATSNQIYNGAKLFLGGRIDTKGSISIRTIGNSAKLSGMSLMSREEFNRLDH